MNKIIKEWNKSCKCIDINTLICITEILDDYVSFIYDLDKLLSKCHSINFIREFYNFATHSKILIPRRYRVFIDKHRDTLEVLRKNRCFTEDNLLGYDSFELNMSLYNLDFFFNYIISHRSELDNIKKVLNKLRKLGIKLVYLGNIDFTNNEYKIYPEYGSEFLFLYKMKVLATYESHPIRYISEESPYALLLEVKGYGKNPNINGYKRHIYLNTLLFDPSILPDEITVESTLDVIAKQFQDISSIHQDVVDIIDYSIAEQELKNAYNIFNNIVLNINRAKNNEELTALLDSLKDTLSRLKLIGEKSEDDICSKYDGLTKCHIDNERKLYLSRRGTDDVY